MECHYAELSTPPRAPFPPKTHILQNGILFLPLGYIGWKSVISLTMHKIHFPSPTRPNTSSSGASEKAASL